MLSKQEAALCKQSIKSVSPPLPAPVPTGDFPIIVPRTLRHLHQVSNIILNVGNFQTPKNHSPKALSKTLE